MKSRDKSVLAVVAFVMMIAAAGFLAFNRREVKPETEQAKTETEKETQITNTNEVEAEIVKEVEVPEEIPEEVVKEVVEVERVEHAFSKEETLIWPVDGNVILNYSMDQTVYFATLDQYKYNPALVIEGEVGEPVMAAADGKVLEVGADTKLGENIHMDLGSGYEMIYGQLQEIRVVDGQDVKQGDVIGYINDPTKYYVVEGPNLYFQLLKDGNPENPLEYMEE